MISRRGALVQLTNECDNLTGFEVGDRVVYAYTSVPAIYGTVEAVDPKIGKVFVKWSANLEATQHDPDELKMEPVYAVFKSSKKFASCRPKVAADVELQKQFVGDLDTHGVDSPVRGGFSIMQDLVDDLRKEQKTEVKDSPKTAGVVPGVPDGTGPYGRGNRKDEVGCPFDDSVETPEDSSTASLRSRRAMYWTGKGRTYRLTKDEQENGQATCAKCGAGMKIEPFTKSEKLYTCPKCGFKVQTSKVVTNKIEIEVDDEGGVEIDVKKASRRCRAIRSDDALGGFDDASEKPHAGFWC